MRVKSGAIVARVRAARCECGHGAQSASGSAARPLGRHQAGGRPVGRDVDLPAGRAGPRSSAASSTSLASTWPGRPALGVSSTMKPWSESLVRPSTRASTRSPSPSRHQMQHPVGDVVVVLVLELGPDDVLDREPQVVVDVVVIAELLDDLPLGKSELAEGRRSRGLAHCHRSSRSWSSVSWRRCHDISALGPTLSRKAASVGDNAHAAPDAPRERTAYHRSPATDPVVTVPTVG